MTKFAPIVAKIFEAQARLEVVEDILSFETHPAERARYARERGRIKSRIRDYEFALKFAPRIRAAA